jgi:acyl carrier protein
MEKGKFFEELRETLELNDVINENSTLTLSSLEILSVIALVDENFDLQIKAAELKSINSVNDLMILIGLEKFK